MDLLHHSAFKNTDPAFLQSLEKTLASISYKSDIEVIGALMGIANEAQKRGIAFTPQMQLALLDYFKNRLPVNKRKQFEAMIKVLSSNTK